ncbi:hypothetical protein JCM9279_002402 [Rhodotorula babjevae]
MPPRPSTRASSSAAASKAPASPPTPPQPPTPGQYDVVLNVQDGAKTLTVWPNNDEAVQVSTKSGDAQPAVKRERRDLVTSRPHTRHVELATEGAKTVFSMSTTYGSAGRKLDEVDEVEVDQRARCSSPRAKKRKVDTVAPVGFVPGALKLSAQKAPQDHITLEIGVKLSTPFFKLDEYDGYDVIELDFTTYAVGGKPVIYLFPPSPLARAQVSLALSPEWTFSALYPVVDISEDVVEAKGVAQAKQRVEWTVAAEPDGSLVELSSGLELSYLFWEATSTGVITSSSSQVQAQQVDLEPSFHPTLPSLDASNGVVLPFTPFLAHLDAALSSLSLHTSARNDFITFWIPHFNRIRDDGKEILFRFLPQAEYARAAELEVEPKPDVVTRIFLLFKGVEPGTSSSLMRSAAEVDWVRVVGVDEVKMRDDSLFRVLEWGGMECV